MSNLQELVNTKRTEKDIEGRLKKEGTVICKTIEDIMVVIKRCMNTPDSKEIIISTNILLIYHNIYLY